MKDRSSSINRLGFAIGGSALSLLAVVAGRVGLDETLNYLTGLRSQVLVVLLAYGVVLFLVDVGGAERRRDPVLWMVRHVGAHSVAWLLSLAFAYFQGLDRLGRGIVGLFGIVNVTLFVTCGLLTDRLATRLLPKKRTIVLGTGELVNLLVGQLLETKESPWVPVAILDAESDEAGTPAVSSECSVYRHVDELRQIVDKERAECVVLVPPYKADADLYQQIARCRLAGVEVRDAVEVCEYLRGRVPLDFVAEYWALFLSLSRVAPVNVVAKRALDVTVSIALLIASLPILAVTALLIRLLDGAPVLFSQERLGQDGKPFHIIKFRTMIPDAERVTGPIMARNGDPRATRLGRVLRRWRVDELPQLINVVRGEMSLVGPRPEREAFVSDFRRQVPAFRPGRRKDDPAGTFVYDGWRETIHAYSLRLLVRPGLTGWAQVRSPYGGSLEEKREQFEYDLHYIKNQSLLFDVAILCRTPLALISVKGR